MEYSLIANSGIQLFTFQITINTQDRYRLWYHEWYDTQNGQWRLDPVYKLEIDGCEAYYNKKELNQKGYLNCNLEDITMQDLHDDGINPLRIDDAYSDGVRGEIFSFSFTDADSKMNMYEDKWLPLPYFFKRSEKRLKFGPMNWSRAKFIFRKEEKGKRIYDVILAFDTKASYESDEYDECPSFPNRFDTDMNFKLCDNEFMLMDYCSFGEKWSYINDYLFSTVNPDAQKVRDLKGKTTKKMAYLATYSLLIKYLADHALMPEIKLYKESEVEHLDVDMVIDIGNSKTTVLLIENNSNFNQVRMLNMQDYTKLVQVTEEGCRPATEADPFDMRITFRKVDFGSFGIKDSRQFVYPSLVRLGKESNYLIHCASETNQGLETLSTYSSPKRYLWDWRPSKEEWRFLILPDEKQEAILNLRGITNYLKSDGSLDPMGNGGTSFHYSRKSLMTFAFLEMVVQANTQINSFNYRSEKTGFGYVNLPRRIKRMLVTCPTAMSKLERENLTKSAKDAVTLFDKFYYGENLPDDYKRIEVIPTYAHKEEGSKWYYDEATCAQLVYMYGEAGHKYKGFSSEFFELYGRYDKDATQPSLTVASLDIGAGTSDLMINKYTYTKTDITTITPSPLFYDSFYYAGDDMLKALIKNIMLLNENTSAFRKNLKDVSQREYRQLIKNFFGPDFSEQTMSDRILRKNFNIQYSVPLMHYFLDLLSKDSENCVVRYADVFEDVAPNAEVVKGFKEKMGIDLYSLEWVFDKEEVEKVIRDEFEPLLKKIATIMYSFAADIILLSGRPSSLNVIRDLFLKYYSVAPNRLIVLNNYYVGDWYPFGNNTGYIRNSKTIVAMGGVIAYYASELSNLNRFVIDKRKLDEKLQSTVKYIDIKQDSTNTKYLITPEKNIGDVLLTSLPEKLNIRQLGIDTYPSRPLYCIDFNRYKMKESARRNYERTHEEYATEAKLHAIVNEMIDELKKRMPFRVVIERGYDDLEALEIQNVTDKDGNEVSDSCLEIHVQSLGVNDQYWLDSGVFEF